MDTSTKENFEAKRASGQLGGRWRVWEGFQGGKNKGNYADLMAMVYPVESLEDIAYLFNNTSYGNPSKFFFCVEKRTTKKYQPLGYVLKVNSMGQGPGQAGRRPEWQIWSLAWRGFIERRF